MIYIKELVLNMLAEVTSTEISKNSNEFGYKDAINSVKRGYSCYIIYNFAIEKYLFINLSIQFLKKIKKLII